MPRYKMEDGVIADTELATQSWREASDWNGSNRIGRSSNSQWHNQSIHRSRKGRYWLETRTRVDHEQDTAGWITPEEAAAWLLLNESPLPDDLQALADDVTE